MRTKTIAGSVALVALILSASVIPAAAARPSFSDRLVTALGSPTDLSETVNHDGSITDTWMVDGFTVTATGPAHSVLTADMITTKTPNGNVHTVTTALTVPAPAKSATRNISNVSAASIFASPCVSWSKAGLGNYKGCDVIYMIQQSGANWYLGDEDEITAYISSPGHLQGVAIDNYWTINNKVVHWSPLSNDIPIGSCTTAQVSVTYIIGLSESFTECPAYYGNFSRDYIGRDFGGIWEGNTQNKTEGVDAVDIVNDPANASPGYTLRGSIGYTTS
jgi:hypothetical protein